MCDLRYSQINYVHKQKIGKSSGRLGSQYQGRDDTENSEALGALSLE